MRTSEHIKETKRIWFQKNKARIIPERKAYIKNWVANNKERMRITRRKWKLEHMDIVRESNRLSNERNKDKTSERKKRWVLRNPERNRMNNKILHQGYKLQVISAYGGHCACCGEDSIEFLTIEHSKHDGQSHRKVKGVFYLSLIRRGFPQDEGLSVLCMNCNWATRLEKVCPHKRKVLEVLA